MKTLRFHSLLLCALTLLLPAWARAQKSTWQHLGLGIGGLIVHWGDTPAQVKEQTRYGLADRFKLVGVGKNVELYEISGLSFTNGRPDQEAKAPDAFVLQLYFRNGKLDEFEMRPMNERADNIIGVENILPTLDLLVQHSGWKNESDNIPRWYRFDTAPVRWGETNYLADAPLGFDINTVQWSEYGIYHRIIVAADDAGGHIRLVRHQARPDRPFSTPIDAGIRVRNGDRALLGAAVLGNIGVSPEQLDAILKMPNLFGGAPKPLALQINEAPKPAHGGKWIGFFGYRFGMSAAEIKAMPAPAQTQMRAVSSDRKGMESLILSGFNLLNGSDFSWDLQFWIGKKGLAEYEVRPHEETHSPTFIGAKNALTGMDELRIWSQQVYGAGLDDWWENYTDATGTARGAGAAKLRAWMCPTALI